ncbi:SmpA / OmlA family [Brevundimonas diminuta]|jgi:outer membrane protein assembly factor BamE (lipoprotein component of BamABCDE complex)|uniref:Outer membrane protein assembly factor BamE n=2 Tax=Brevundimonas TaxID=41275 RepID=A0A246K850_BREDI|nr:MULTISPECIES: outer membrane protein assembly factor BamE [Brevundimonas]OJU49658.1 MAG: cell envelope protein SmpA [Brevundimonas sp. 67-6]ASD28195.1 outer membrane protein assembly factor BamE [Brevundimonas diminuta]EGF94350.1 smpA / OmlA family protein [Brevundimonas diminuta ATCC 11568]MBD3572327.1 outer membrane protein assembly factor BamE [Brevundimonas diminuta]MBD3819115.1 outer membrane protein assembly factor BamE [Brevundimonas diminuta]
MPRFTSLIIAASLAAAAGACAPVVATQGFQAVDAKPQDIEAGVDTRETVLAKLGTPSTTSTFETDNVWYYLTQTTQRYTYNKPEVSQRTVTEITFADGGEKVANVRTLGLEDGRQIAMERRETPTRGRQLTILEQLLGNVGRGQLPRTEDDVPGQRRPD